MWREIGRFFVHSYLWRIQGILWIAGVSVGLAAYGIVEYQTLVWQDLFRPTWSWGGFALSGVFGIHAVWLAYSLVLARWSGRSVSTILQQDACSYSGLMALLGVWLKHIEIPASFAFVFAISVVVAWKVWNLPVTWPLQENKAFQTYGFRGVLSLTIVYIVVFSVLSGLRVMGLQSYGDFASMIQPIWGFANGRMLFMTHLGNSFWGGHFWPTLVLLGPIYRLYEHPVTLVVIQSVALGIGAIPIYRLARQKLQSSILSAVFAMGYLVYPAIQLPNLGDFHETLLVPALLLFTLYSLETGRYAQSCIFALLTLGCKEDMAIPVFMIGLYALVVKRAYRIGTVLSAGSLLWFVVVVFQVIPHFAQGDPYLYVQASPLHGNASDGLRGIMTGLLDRVCTVSNGISLVQLLLPLGFLATVAPFPTFMAAAPLGELFVYTGPPFGLVGTIYTWHIATVAPFMFFAAITGAATLRRGLWRLAPESAPTRSTVTVASGLAVCLIGANASFGATPFRPDFNWQPYSMTEHAQTGHRLLQLIPPDAPVTATAELAAHLSHREEIYQFPNPFIRVNWFSETRKPVSPEYVMVDTSAVALARMENPQAFLEGVRQVGQRPDYETLRAQDGYVVFKRRER